MAAATTRTAVAEGVLDANDALAAANRARCEQAGVAVVNLMSSPGAGKTTLLEQTADRLAGTLRIGVIEGDVQTSLDADRLRRRGVPAVQISTEGFGAACHLDARMVQHGLAALPLTELDLLVIENVGNLVCPAEFALGEHRRVLVCSLPEGEEKPLKYPLMFRAADLVLVNKIDLAPYLGVDVARLLANIDAVHPGVETHLASARTGEGVEAWCEWLGRRDLTAARERG